MTKPTQFEFALLTYRRDVNAAEAEEISITIKATSPGNARRKIVSQLHARGFFVAAIIQTSPPETFGD